MKNLHLLALVFCFFAVQLDAEPNALPIKTIAPEQFHKEALKDLSNKINQAKIATIHQLAKWQKEGSVLLIDLRNEVEFKKVHIKGAVNLPVGEITAETLSKIAPDKDMRIVVYCQQNLFPTRLIALTTLGAPTISQHGYSNVHRLEEFWNKPGCESHSVFFDNNKANCPISFIKD